MQRGDARDYWVERRFGTWHIADRPANGLKEA
jgi:hypothetical protein